MDYPVVAVHRDIIVLVTVARVVEVGFIDRVPADVCFYLSPGIAIGASEESLRRGDASR